MPEPLSATKTPEELKAEQQAADEAKFRSYVKDKYGIEDDPETFTNRRKKWEEAETAVPQYQEALSYAQQIAQENARLKTERETLQRQVQQPPLRPEDEEARWRAEAEKDPWGTLMKMRRQDAERYQTLLARHARSVDERVLGMTQAQLQSQTVAQSADERIRKEWPDAYDRTTDLHKAGNEVFWREFDDYDRARPQAHLRATEIAAARLGVSPASKRTSGTKEIGDEVESQNVGSKGRRPKGDETEKLSADERKLADLMEVDHDMMAKAKQARREKKDLKAD